MEYIFFYASLFFIFLIFKVLRLGSFFFNRRSSAVLVYGGGAIVYAVLFILCIRLSLSSTDYKTVQSTAVNTSSNKNTSDSKQSSTTADEEKSGDSKAETDSKPNVDVNGEKSDFTGEEACVIAEKYYGENADTGYKYDTNPVMINGGEYFYITAYSKSMNSQGGTGTLFIVLVNEKEEVYDAYEYKDSGSLVKAQK